MSTKIVRLQPSEYVDQVTADGAELTRLPYPFFVDEDGKVGRQDVWRGKPLEVVGFQADLAAQQVDLWWEEAFRDPQQAVGMYAVTRDDDGNLSSQVHAIRDVEVIETGEPEQPEEPVWTYEVLQTMPTLGESQSDDLKWDGGNVRVWLARTGPEDGEKYEHRVSLEVEFEDGWKVVAEWEANR